MIQIEKAVLLCTAFFMRIFISVILFLYVTLTFAAEKLSADDMKRRLEFVDPNTKVEFLYKIAWSERKVRKDTALHYANRALSLAKEIDDKHGIIKSLTTLGVINKISGEYYKSLGLYEKALSVATLTKDEYSQAKLFNNIGVVHKALGNYDLAAQYYEKAIPIKKKNGRTKSLANSLSNLGVIYKKQNQFDPALKCYLEALEIRQELGDSIAVALTMNNIGNVYNNKKATEQAEIYFTSALDILKRQGDNKNVALVYNNFGIMYLGLQRPKKAVHYYQKAIEIYEQIDSKYDIGLAYINLGQSYLHFNAELGKRFLEKGLDIGRDINNVELLLMGFMALGEYYENVGENDLAVKYYDAAIIKGKQLKSTADVQESTKSLAENLFASGKVKAAYDTMHVYGNILKDRYDFEVAENAKRLEAIYQNGKLEKEISSLNAEQELAEKRRLIQWLVFGGVMLFVLIIGVVVYRNIKMRQRHLKVVQAQKQKVEEQRDLITHKNREITSSIEYAKKIQNAVLTFPDVLREKIGGYFVFYFPKDIVSGDFYWAQQIGSKVFFAAADCTGHGVPGAMVSVVCINALNKVVRELKIEEPAKVLDETSSILETSFEQGLEKEGIADGMDLSLCCFDTETKVLSYAGANNPLYIARPKSSALIDQSPLEPILDTDTHVLYEIKPDVQPIGKYFAREPFSNHEIQLATDDAIYSFTDGFADQFGGPKGKKFKYKPFKRLLLSVQGKSMNEQHDLLKAALIDWKGDLDQIDDICILGVKVN